MKKDSFGPLQQQEMATAAIHIDCNPLPAFAIDANHVVTHWNKACALLTGVSSDAVVGTRNHWQAFYPHQRPLMADMIVTAEAEDIVRNYYGDKVRAMPSVEGAYEGVDFFPHLGKGGLWVSACAAPLRDSHGRLVGAMQILRDVTGPKNTELKLRKTNADLETLLEQRSANIGRVNERLEEEIKQRLYKAQTGLESLIAKRTEQLAQSNVRLEEDIRQREVAEAELMRRNAELTELNTKLSKAQAQLMQSDKLASIGQLAAGVAHEINNPIGYVFSNFGTLEIYLQNLMKILGLYEEAAQYISSPEMVARINDLSADIELDYVKEDIPTLMSESKEGITRVRKIVQDLKDFSRPDVAQEWQWTNLHQGIDSTLNIVNNEIKYKADLIKEYGDLPDIECFPSQINQVVMNLVVNAAHSISGARGKITIRTGSEGGNVWIEIRDTGAGISKDNLSRIFDPFFTTKPIGQGTGLGLSLSYGIVLKHQGRIDVDSEIGLGTTFKITLPIKHVEPPVIKDTAA